MWQMEKYMGCWWTNTIDRASGRTFFIYRVLRLRRGKNICNPQGLDQSGRWKSMWSLMHRHDTIEPQSNIFIYCFSDWDAIRTRVIHMVSINMADRKYVVVNGRSRLGGQKIRDGRPIWPSIDPSHPPIHSFIHSFHFLHSLTHSLLLSWK